MAEKMVSNEDFDDFTSNVQQACHQLISPEMLENGQSMGYKK